LKKQFLGGATALALVIAIFGLPPFSGGPAPDYAEGEVGFETGVKRLPNGIYEVSALTPMPGVTPEMVRWWFADYMQTTDMWGQATSCMNILARTCRSCVSSLSRQKKSSAMSPCAKAMSRYAPSRACWNSRSMVVRCAI